MGGKERFAMEYILNDYQPARLFHYFEEISAIPRGSGNEKGIADYLVRFAEERNLRYYRDADHNVILYAPATPGYEGKPAVMLQGHTDMVCEKNSGTVHDFEKDGLRLAVKNDMLYAEGTTLGGDDGIAVAMMLEVLSDDRLPHPDLECLFTVGEETGLVGAASVDTAKLAARKIINIDTEKEGEAVASCAGSLNVHFLLEKETVPFQNQAVRITLTGLKGGHSGTDIGAGRQNAILLMGRLLTMLYDELPFNLVSLTGGNKRNAIPRECEAVISVLDREKAIAAVKDFAAAIAPELGDADRGMKLRAAKTGKSGEMYTYRATSAMLSFLSLLPNGVIAMSPAVDDFVETSSNLGVVRTDEDGVRFDVYSRSSVENATDYVVRRLERLGKVTGLRFFLDERSAGWQFVPDTPLQKLYLQTSKALYPDRPAAVVGIHAGLECGLLLDRLGGGDAISIGPDLRDIHTPSETLDLRSAERIYALVREMLKNC